MFLGVELLRHSADHGPQGGDHPLTEAICGLLRRPGQYYNNEIWFIVRERYF